MTLARKFIATTALGLSLMATTATAELTAAQVWGDWRSYLEGLGYVVTANPTPSGNTLSVNDISVEMNSGRAMVLQIGTLEFVENADGSVNVVMPARMPLTLELAADDISPAARIAVDYTQSGHAMTVRGDPTAMTYDYAADSFGLALASLMVDGDVMDANTARFALTGTGLTSRTDVSVSGTRSYDQKVNMDGMSYELMFNAPEEVEALSIKSTLGAMSFTGTSTVPPGAAQATEDLTPLLAAGFAFDGSVATQGSETEIEITSDEGTSKIKTASASTTLAVEMDSAGLRYGVQSQEVQIGAQLAGLPFPLFAESASSGFELRTPVVKSDDPQDFKLALDMTDFTMSDIIWSLFDAAGQLPRDPATIALDLSGTAKMLFDPLDAQALQRSGVDGGEVAELNSLRIDRLTVDALGAKVEATGDVTFDNTDKVTLPGFPKPLGEVNIDIAGANGLMDKLVAMGMLPAEQVMGARFMMGLFTVPGTAPDTLTSRIEFNAEGQILANGQRIR